MSEMTAGRDKFPLPLIVLILITSVMVIAGAVLFYKSQKNRIVKLTYYELGIIASLKAEEVYRWRKEHVRDGYLIRNFVPSGRMVYSILGDNPGIVPDLQLRQRIEMFIKDYDYYSVKLADNSGRIRFSYPAGDTSHIRFSPVHDFRAGEIEFSNLHYSEDIQKLHMDIMLPIIPHDSTGLKNLGALILRIDPEISLFPALRLMTMPFINAEVLLVTREGDSLTYLNTKDQYGKPVKEHINNYYSQVESADEGEERMLEYDYAKMPVMFVFKKITDSPWYIMVKINREHVLSSIYVQTIMASIIVLLFIFSVTAIVFYLWRNQKSHFYKELSRTKDRFISIITHDLTNPFVSIVGFSEYLINNLHYDDKSSAVKFANIIHDSSLAAVNLIKNLAQWSRIQTDQIRINPVTFDFVVLLSETIELMNAVARKKEIKVRYHSPPNLLITADKDMISTVMRNLIGNAIKYSLPSSEIIINVETEEKNLRVEVQDSGVGISKDIINRIFYFNESITTPGTMDESGTGLGLTLCKEFIERHRGSINAKSEEGQGSKFVFIIPLHCF